MSNDQLLRRQAQLAGDAASRADKSSFPARPALLEGRAPARPLAQRRGA